MKICVALLISLLSTSGLVHAARVPVETCTPFLKGALGARARDAFAAKDFDAAVKLLSRYVRTQSKHRAQAEMLLALALAERDEHARAEALLARLVTRYPLLADYHRYLRARSLYALRRFREAAQVTKKVSQRSVLAMDAALIEADALGGLGNAAAAAEIWRRYLAARPYGARAAEALLRVAKDLEASARARGTDAPRLRAEAATQNRRLLVRAPLSKHAPDAARALTRLASTSPAGAISPALDANELYAQSLVYYRKMRNVLAEKGFARAIAAGLSTPKDCRARYYRAKSAFKQRQRARAASLFEEAVKACREQKETTFVVKSLYNQARGLYSKGEYRRSAQLFLALEREFSSHSYADDARLRAAEAVAELKKRKEVEELLRRIPERYPDGDMGREALWRLAKNAYFKGDLSAALRWLERILMMKRARVYYAEGRALYWRARILARQGKRRAAVETYERCIREYPLSYYALQAFNRLRERHAKTYRRLTRELLTPIGAKAGQWSFMDAELLRKPSFRRGVELARLGLGEWAGRELARAGLSTRRGAAKERLWLAAALFHRAGLWHLSHQVPRSRDRRHQRSYPLGDNVRPWRISYPLAFAAFVKREARRNKIPPQLAWAVMREESGFSRKLESYANAIGLMQLILPTARAAASFHRLRVDRKQLHRPKVNIKLGCTFLGYLDRTFAGQKPLVIAGYNAGHGAVRRWLKRFRGAKLDELLERIPYHQTRRYTKRVLASYFAYSVLHGRKRRPPTITQKLPAPRSKAFRDGGKRAKKKKKKKKKKR